MSFLELKNITKSYKLGKQTFPVLKDISLKFDRGEFVSILGESGGGKTTLLNIIGGLDSQFGGDVLINGKSIKSASESNLDSYRSKTIGFIFQSFNLISHLTILQNVLIPLEMSTLSKTEKVERATMLLKKVGLTEHINKYPNQLSGGQKQRVAIARALANDPDVIIADEPTGALDAKNTAEVLQILEQIAQDNKLVLTVTHSQQVADYGTRIVKIVDGQVASDTENRAKYPVKPDAKKAQVKHLSFMDSFRMSLDHMRYYKGRNILITIGAAIGIFAVIFMLGLGSGVTGYITNQMNKQINPRAVQVSRNMEQMQDTSDPNAANLSNNDFSHFKKIKNVKNVQKGYFASNVKISQGNNSSAEPLFQSWNQTEKVSDIKTGHAPKTNQIVLTKDTAKKINKNYKQLVGQNVQISINTFKSKTQPVQLTQTVKVSGIINSGTSAITYGTIKDMFNANGVKLNPNFATLNVNSIPNVKGVQTKIKSYTMKNAKGKTVKSYQVTGVGAMIDTLDTYLNLAFNVLAGVAGISLLVSAIMIIVVLYISVSERTKEIGILRAIGARKKDIRNLFVSEGLMLGTFAGILATIIAYIAQWLANMAAQSAIHMPIVAISGGNVAFGIIVSILISLLASFAPSRRAAKLDPRDALADE